MVTVNFINGVPKKVGEYDSYISSIINEQLFKLLTSPKYFNEQLKWQDKRKTLLEVCGSFSDADVFASNKNLKTLSLSVGNLSIDDFKEKTSYQQKKLKEELKLIPARIDEATKAMPETVDNAKDVEFELVNYRGQRAKLEAKLHGLKSGGAIADLNVELTHIASSRFSACTTIDEWVKVIEDCKGYRTKTYLHKKRLMKQIYGIDILET